MIDDEGLEGIECESDYDGWWWVYTLTVLAAFMLGILVGLASS